MRCRSSTAIPGLGPGGVAKIADQKSMRTSRMQCPIERNRPESARAAARRETRIDGSTKPERERSGPFDASLCKPEVAGSIPARSAGKRPWKQGFSFPGPTDGSLTQPGLAAFGGSSGARGCDPGQQRSSGRAGDMWKSEGRGRPMPAKSKAITNAWFSEGDIPPFTNA
jgi:hypothetical protein